MLDLSAFDLDLRPGTYWPEGFRPVALEKKGPPVHKRDPGGSVYQAADGSYHWLTFPDEIVIVEVGTEDAVCLTARRDEDGFIIYRFVGNQAVLFASPPLYRPGIERSREPLSLGEVVFSLDNTIMSDRLTPSTLNIAAYLWMADMGLTMSRTERMMNVSRVRFRSRVYPQLEKYYATVGGHYVQTGELHEVDELP